MLRIPNNSIRTGTPDLWHCGKFWDIPGNKLLPVCLKSYVLTQYRTVQSNDTVLKTHLQLLVQSTLSEQQRNHLRNWFFVAVWKTTRDSNSETTVYVYCTYKIILIHAVYSNFWVTSVQYCTRMGTEHSPHSKKAIRANARAGLSTTKN